MYSQITQTDSTRRGFTVVELLIVIVVIGILATLTIIAYSGVQNNARASVISSDLAQAAKKLDAYKYKNSEAYPSGTLSNAQTLAGFTSSPNTTMTYYSNTDAKSYCLEQTSTQNASIVQSVSSKSTTPVAAPCSQNGLIGWWTMNGSPADSTSYANNGTVVLGASLTTGQNGATNGAYNFQGVVNQAITLPRPAVYTNTNTDSFTLSAWIRTTDTNGQRCVFSTASSGNGIRFGHSGGSPYYLMGNGNSHSEGTAGTYTGINNGAWHNTIVAFTNMGTYWRLFSYVDGVAYGYTDVTLNAAYNFIGSGGVAGLGSMNMSSNGYFAGDMDDVRFFGRAITSGEALQLYQRGAS